MADERTEEQKDAVIQQVKISLQEGECMPKLEPSLLGLKWEDLLDSGKESQGRRYARRDPPEFISIGLKTLDAYIISVLAAHFSFEELGFLDFRCYLIPNDDGGMNLRYEVIPQHGRIEPDRITVEMLHSFPLLLRSLGCNVTVYFLEGEFCPMSFAYPGQMRRECATTLNDRQDDSWPVIPVRIVPTPTLRRRAQQILDFLGSESPLTNMI